MSESDMRGLLHDYARGKLSEPDAGRVSELLRSDPALRGQLEEIKGYYAALESLGPVPDAEGFLEGVHRRIDEGSRVERFFRSLFLPLKLKLPLEAVGLVAVGLLVIAIFNPLSMRTRSIMEPLSQRVAIETPPPGDTPVDEPAASLPPASEAQAPADPAKTPVSASASPGEPKKAARLRRPPARAAEFAEEYEATSLAQAPAAAGKAASSVAPSPSKPARNPEVHWTLQLADAPAAATFSSPAPSSAPSAGASLKRSERHMSDETKSAAPLREEELFDVKIIERLASRSGATLVELTGEDASGCTYRIRMPSSRLPVFQNRLRQLGFLSTPPDTVDPNDDREVTLRLVVRHSTRE